MRGLQRCLLSRGQVVWCGRGFSRTVRAIIREELSRVWKDQDDIEARLSALELSLRFVRDQLNELREMMQAHIEDK